MAKPVNEAADKAPDRIERIYYDKGKKILKEEIPYKNNRIDGIRREYRENGTIYECCYKDGEKDGTEREYGDDGRMISETFYVKGTADGPFAVLSFYTSSVDIKPFTILETIGRYVQGKYDGLVEHYAKGIISLTEIYDQGKKLRMTQWHNGIRHGKDTCYDTSGNPIRTASYNNGEITRVKKGGNLTLGPEYDYDSYPVNKAYKKTLPLESCRAASYYSIDDSIDGVNEVEIEYDIREGSADGMWKHYYENNLIEGAVPYKSGRANGTVRKYYYSGALFSETIFVDGEKDGLEKYYEDRSLPLWTINHWLPPGKPAKVLHFRRGIQTDAAEGSISMIFSGKKQAFGRKQRGHTWPPG